MTLLGQEKPSLEALAHHGVKGMKWGVRSNKDSSDGSSDTPKTPLFTDRQKDIAKKATIAVGVVAIAAGAAYAAYALKQSGAVKVSDLSKVTDVAKGAEAATHLVKEPTDFIHATRGREHGFEFLRKGGIKNHLSEFEKAFGRDTFDNDMFKRYDGKIAASFNDLEGRKDFAGRTIPHQIIIPSHLTDGINNIDDVKTKIYPTLKDAADELYNRPRRM